MFAERTSVGLDVRASSVAEAAIDGVTGELFQTKLTPLARPRLHIGADRQRRSKEFSPN